MNKGKSTAKKELCIQNKWFQLVHPIFFFNIYSQECHHSSKQNSDCAFCNNSADMHPACIFWLLINLHIHFLLHLYLMCVFIQNSYTLNTPTCRTPAWSEYVSGFFFFYLYCFKINLQSMKGITIFISLNLTYIEALKPIYIYIYIKY